MRVPAVLLVVAWVAGVCLCRPEDTASPECEEGEEEECFNLARQYTGTHGTDDHDHDHDHDHDEMHDMGAMGGMGGEDDMGGMDEMDDMDDMDGMGDMDMDDMDGMGDMGGGDDMDGMGMGGMGDVDGVDDMDDVDMDGVGDMDDMDDMGGRDVRSVMDGMGFMGGMGYMGSGDMREDDGVTDDDVEHVRVSGDEDEDTTTTTTTDPPSTPPSIPSSPIGPPKSHLTSTKPPDDLNTETTDSTTDSTPETSTPLAPVGPPVHHLARQGPKGVSLRRPRPGPFPTPHRSPLLVGLIGFTLRGANNTRKRGRVTFKTILYNLSKGWKASSNSFIAPLYGFYLFSVHATSTRNSSFKLALSVNGVPQVFAYASRGFRHGCVSAVLRLKPGWVVTLDLQRGAIYEPPGRKDYTVLTGLIVSIDLRKRYADEGRIRYRKFL
ncbi:uncharacterized protein LOC127007833 [Eriocheir sinensis]|uniref:uncharacterized protein LOC127007833 n=1 Tax=Eriocheir sinensis TaxID=95602 RepID=UPI0021C56EB0|nr:uncharacterized protein LOC127007833 [Eriocheir sinensis]